MTLIVNNLTSLDLYTKYPLDQVLETDTLTDTSSGMNPCYYIKQGNKIKVSSSVTSLIADSGSFEINQNYKPPKFFLHPWQRHTATFFRNTINLIEKKLRNTSILKIPALKKIKSITPTDVKTFLWNPHHSSYSSYDTIDVRIKKLRAFESIDKNQSRITITPDFSLNDLNAYLEKSAYYLRKSINDIEAMYPDKKHIILMGGKDSQLISLIPKLHNNNWYIFSAAPNNAIIKNWISDNNIQINQIFDHDGRNEETFDEFKKKLICSDIYTNPIHVRYAPALKRISQKFDNNCIFWLGSMPRSASFYDGTHHKKDPSKMREDFFYSHFENFPNWQGNIHQTYSNYIECPFLCPYYLKDIWLEVYAHLDPLIIPHGHDLRPQLGEMLAGRKITWPAENPGPTVYKYWYFWFNSYNYYKNYIYDKLS